jgi:hypothetical protein
MGYNYNIALIDNYNNYLSMQNLTPASIFFLFPDSKSSTPVIPNVN